MSQPFLFLGAAVPNSEDSSRGVKGAGMTPAAPTSTQKSPSAAQGPRGAPSLPHPKPCPYMIPQSTGHTCYGMAEPALYTAQDRCNKINLLPLSPNRIIET